MEEISQQQSPGIKPCKNCAADVSGHTFCPVCGQRGDTHVLTFRELFDEFVDGLLNMDSRVWRTLLPLALYPGQLTVEYLKGRRMYYLPPFRLYLILSVLFFLIAANNGNVGENFGQDNNNPETSSVPRQQCTLAGLPQGALFTIVLRDACLKFLNDPQRLTQNLLDLVPIMMIVGIPLVALFMHLVYFRSGRYYVEHIIFLLHTHAFFFFASIAMALSSALGQRYDFLFGSMNWFRIIASWYIPIYIFMAMLKVYGDSLTKTFFKGFFVMSGYLFSILVVTFFSILYTAWNV